jgi:hypothetical protein
LIVVLPVQEKARYATTQERASPIKTGPTHSNHSLNRQGQSEPPNKLVWSFISRRAFPNIFSTKADFGNWALLTN